MAAPIPAVTTESFLKKKKEREELERNLSRIAELNAIKDSAEEELRELKPNVASLLVSHGIKKVEFDGYDFSVFNGTNVTFSGEKAKTAMLKLGVSPDIIVAVLNEATKATPYTTIMTKAAKPKTEIGGLTGK